MGIKDQLSHSLTKSARDEQVESGVFQSDRKSSHAVYKKACIGITISHMAELHAHPELTMGQETTEGRA